ncbi:hypothetical protein OAE19_05095 [Porticoccaceae bacterium]|nr:hypothetical protein [Porticoccaceae bacterium]
MKIEKISVKDQLPNDNEYVLIHSTNKNLIDSDDPKGNRYWSVAKFIRGMSEEDRKKLPSNHPHKRSYGPSDVSPNNKVPYSWSEIGPQTHYGQDVDFWCRLPF